MTWLFAVLMTLLGALGAFFFKKSTGGSSSLLGLLTCRWLYIGGMFYVAGALINIVLLRYMEYSVVYPMTAITYVWTLVISNRFLGEPLTGRKLAGVLLICAGVWILSQ